MIGLEICEQKYKNMTPKEAPKGSKKQTKVPPETLWKCTQKKLEKNTVRARRQHSRYRGWGGHRGVRAGPREEDNRRRGGGQKSQTPVDPKAPRGRRIRVRA